MAEDFDAMAAEHYAQQGAQVPLRMRPTFTAPLEEQQAARFNPSPLTPQPSAPLDPNVHGQPQGNYPLAPGTTNYQPYPDAPYDIQEPGVEALPLGDLADPVSGVAGMLAPGGLRSLRQMGRNLTEPLPRSVVRGGLGLRGERGNLGPPPDEGYRGGELRRFIRAQQEARGTPLGEIAAQSETRPVRYAIHDDPARMPLSDMMALDTGQLQVGILHIPTAHLGKQYVARWTFPLPQGRTSSHMQEFATHGQAKAFLEKFGDRYELVPLEGMHRQTWRPLATGAAVAGSTLLAGGAAEAAGTDDNFEAMAAEHYARTPIIATPPPAVRDFDITSRAVGPDQLKAQRDAERAEWLRLNRPALAHLTPEMADEEIITRLGGDPALVKQSRYYQPGMFQRRVSRPDSQFARTMDGLFGGVAMGALENIDALNQLKERGLRAVGLGSDADVALANVTHNLRVADYAQNITEGRSVDPRTGELQFEGSRLAGNVGAGLATMPAATGLVRAGVAGLRGIPEIGQVVTPLAEQAARLVGSSALARGAVGGAIGALEIPLTGAGQQAEPGATTLPRVGFGAAGGAVLGAASEKIVAPLVGKAVNMARGRMAPRYQTLMDLSREWNADLDVSDIAGSDLPWWRRYAISSEKKAIFGMTPFRQQQGPQAQAAMARMDARLRQELGATAYDDLAMIEQAAQTDGPYTDTAQVVLDRILRAGDEPSQIPAASANAVLLVRKLKAKALYDQVQAQAERHPERVDPTPTIAALDARIKAEQARILGDPQTIGLLREARRSLVTRRTVEEVLPETGPGVPRLQEQWYTPEGRPRQALKDTPGEELELQDFLRKPDTQGKWGVKLTDEELFSEFDALLGKKESGSSRLKNDVSGLTSQEQAERAYAAGFIERADTDALKAALDESIAMDRKVWSVNRTEPEIVYDGLGGGVKRTIVEEPTPQTYEAMREFRSSLGQKTRHAGVAIAPEGVRQLKEVKKAVERNLEAYIGQVGDDDLSRLAKDADTFYRRELAPYTQNRQLVVAMESDAPDRFYSTFIRNTTTPDEAARLFRALDAKGQAAIRLGMLTHAADAATSQAGTFSPRKFASYLHRLRDSSQVFFEGENQQKFNGLVRLNDAMDRASQFAENPPTGARLDRPLAGAATAASALGVSTSSLPVALTTMGAYLASSVFMTKLMTSQGGKALLLTASRLPADAPALSWDRLIQRALDLGGPLSSLTAGRTGADVTRATAEQVGAGDPLRIDLTQPVQGGTP